METITMVTKQHIFARLADPTELIRYVNRPDTNVVPFDEEEIRSRSSGYCKVSLSEHEDGYVYADKIIGFLNHRGEYRHRNITYQLLGNLAVLPNYAGNGHGYGLVDALTDSMLEQGHRNLAAIVNPDSESLFFHKGYRHFDMVESEVDGSMKALYVVRNGILRNNRVK